MSADVIPHGVAVVFTAVLTVNKYAVFLVFNSHLVDKSAHCVGFVLSRNEHGFVGKSDKIVAFYFYAVKDGVSDGTQGRGRGGECVLYLWSGKSGGLPGDDRLAASGNDEGSGQGDP